MSETAVDRLHREFADVVAYLDGGAEISLRSTAEESFRKALLMAATSYFEWRITEDLLAFFEEVSGGSALTVQFIGNKAISRQYHTFFDWERRNANKFYGLFGEEFRELMKGEVAKDEELARSVDAFLELGRERNRLVHQDFATVALEKTAEDIFALYRTATKFVELIPTRLRECGTRAGAYGGPGGRQLERALMERAERLRDDIVKSKLSHTDPWAYTPKARMWEQRAQRIVEDMFTGGDADVHRRALDSLSTEVEGDHDFQEARRLF